MKGQSISVHMLAFRAGLYLEGSGFILKQWTNGMSEYCRESSETLVRRNPLRIPLTPAADSGTGKTRIRVHLKDHDTEFLCNLYIEHEGNAVGFYEFTNIVAIQDEERFGNWCEMMERLNWAQVVNLHLPYCNKNELFNVSVQFLSYLSILISFPVCRRKAGPQFFQCH